MTSEASKAGIILFLDKLRASYWFLPSLMLAVSAALAFVLVGVDQDSDWTSLQAIPWIFTGGHEGARLLLSTVAGAIISVAATTFSITIAVLSFTSSQFGPRLLRGFLRDTSNQLVLGTFVATFLYCLLVLKTIRGPSEGTFVPHIAVTVGVLFAIVSICMLIFFIHHVSSSIQASRIIENVANELSSAIERLFPEKIGLGMDCARDAPGASDLRSESATRVIADFSGYLQAINGDRLLDCAVRHGVVVHLACKPGDFVARGSTIALLAPGEGAGGDTIADVTQAFTFGEERTAAQDCEFLFLQLVEVAVRALSPGINDPFTAHMCLDRIGAGLCRLAGRAFPSPFRHDGQGSLRVVAKVPQFKDFVKAALGQIIHFGGSNPAIDEHLLRILGRIRDSVVTPDRQQVVELFEQWLKDKNGKPQGPSV